MKTKTIFSAIILLATSLNFTAQAQILFHEDFETSPVTSFVNPGDLQLTEGASPCGEASRGNAAIFFSANVNFNGSQNGGYFMAVNPQSPCGGFYVANVSTGTVDLSSADSLVFSCRYYITSTLTWGMPVLQVNIKNGPSNHVIWSEFSAMNNWMNLTVGIPSAQIGATDSILITIGGGEGVAIDDITITNIPAMSVKENEAGNIHVYPNPALDVLNIEPAHFNMTQLSVINNLGETLYLNNVKISNNFSIDLSSFPSGFYTLIATNNKGVQIRKKFLKN
ncbi:MAG: T9SS type A sorting domain-containing protein [Bacteroidota bacterium]